MINALKPFWIYWGVLVFGCILFFICPLLFFVVFPILLIIVPVWCIVVYLIGNAVQQRSHLKNVSKRISLSFLCSFLTIMIFPVGSWVYDIIKWNSFHFDSFMNNFKDLFFWIAFAIHFLIFWIGEETGRAKMESNI